MDDKIITLCCIGIFLLGIFSGWYFSQTDCEKEYDSGYFYGWHESQFIDCTLPELNQTMRVVYMFNNSNWDSRQMYFEWEDLCFSLETSHKQRKAK